MDFCIFITLRSRFNWHSGEAMRAVATERVLLVLPSVVVQVGIFSPLKFPCVEKIEREDIFLWCNRPPLFPESKSLRELLTFPSNSLAKPPGAQQSTCPCMKQPSTRFTEYFLWVWAPFKCMSLTCTVYLQTFSNGPRLFIGLVDLFEVYGTG